MEIVRLKKDLTSERMARGVHEGIKNLMSSGVTAIGDHVSPQGPWREITSSSLRGRLFGEILGSTPLICRQAYQELKQIRQEVERLPSSFSFHPSPHSPYSLDSETFSMALSEEAAPLSIHVAESREEEELFRSGRGDLSEILKLLGVTWRFEGAGPADFLLKSSLPISKVVVVHGNFLKALEIEVIAQKGISLVTCPGSHEYFSHEKSPVAAALEQGINIAIGTDSIASNTELNFLSELHLLRKNSPEIPPDIVLQMATINGARALRLDHEIGTLSAGKKADIIGFPKTEGRAHPLDSILDASHTSFVMIGGTRFL
jgi:cytosine/adenosine deaminase-related metal-dependent hydrolase